MILIKLVVLITGFIAAQYRTTHAELLTSIENTGYASIAVNNSKDNKTVIELNKDITVNTDLNLDKALAHLNGTQASFIPKIRKVSHVDNDSLEDKQIKALDVNSTTVNIAITTTTNAPTQVKNISTESGGVLIELKSPAKNNSEMTEDGQKTIMEKTVSESKTSITNDVNKSNEKVIANSKNVIEIPNQQLDKKNKTIKITTPTTAPIQSTSVVALTTVASKTNNITIILSTTTTASPNISKKNNATTTKSTFNMNTTTTTTTSTTTTPKPRKPTITYSVPDFPDLEKDNPELNSLLHSSATTSDGPYAQPSQEYTSNSFQRGRDFILPIVSMIFIIPLVIGIMITSYRRFRDCWSTRHYRRMDFLVDGMYND